MQTEYKKEYPQVTAAEDLETTQLVSLSGFEESEQLQLASAAAAEPQGQRRAVIVAGIFLGLVLAAALLAVTVLRSGGHF